MKIKPIKAWAIVRKNGSMSIEAWNREYAAQWYTDYDKNESVIPVLITPITKKRKKNV